MTPAVGWPISTRHPTSLSFLCLERLRGCFSAGGAGPSRSSVKKNGIEVKRKSFYIERVMLLQKLTQLLGFSRKKNLPSPLLTFFQDPSSFFTFHSEKPLIMWNHQEKVILLKRNHFKSNRGKMMFLSLTFLNDIREGDCSFHEIDMYTVDVIIYTNW